MDDYTPKSDIGGVPHRRPTDVYVQLALQEGRISVDPSTGAITDPAGNRVEQPRPDGGGRVRVQRYPRIVWAPAHRIVWLAVNGPIPDRNYVRHKNNHRWDNRPTNLELTRRRGCVTYPPEAGHDEGGPSARGSTG